MFSFFVLFYQFSYLHEPKKNNFVTWRVTARGHIDLRRQREESYKKRNMSGERLNLPTLLSCPLMSTLFWRHFYHELHTSCFFFFQPMCLFWSLQASYIKIIMKINQKCWNFKSFGQDSTLFWSILACLLCKVTMLCPFMCKFCSLMK